jgi:hypothetical protein
MIEQFKPIWAHKNRIAAAAILLGALTPGVAGARTVTTCAPSKVTVISQTPATNQTTTSNVFVNVLETARNFTQGGVSSSCVIVDFSAMVNTSASALFVTALLDGNVGAPQYSQMMANNSTFEARSASFIFPGVTPGVHQFILQYRSSVSGQAVRINASNIIIHSAP